MTPMNTRSISPRHSPRISLSMSYSPRMTLSCSFSRSFDSGGDVDCFDDEDDESNDLHQLAAVATLKLGSSSSSESSLDLSCPQLKMLSTLPPPPPPPPPKSSPSAHNNILADSITAVSVSKSSSTLSSTESFYAATATGGFTELDAGIISFDSMIEYDNLEDGLAALKNLLIDDRPTVPSDQKLQTLRHPSNNIERPIDEIGMVENRIDLESSPSLTSLPSTTTSSITQQLQGLEHTLDELQRIIRDEDCSSVNHKEEGDKRMEQIASNDDEYVSFQQIGVVESFGSVESNEEMENHMTDNILPFECQENIDGGSVSSSSSSSSSGSFGIPAPPCLPLDRTKQLTIRKPTQHDTASPSFEHGLPSTVPKLNSGQTLTNEMDDSMGSSRTLQPLTDNTGKTIDLSTGHDLIPDGTKKTINEKALSGVESVPVDLISAEHEHPHGINLDLPSNRLDGKLNGLQIITRSEIPMITVDDILNEVESEEEGICWSDPDMSQNTPSEPSFPLSPMTTDPSSTRCCIPYFKDMQSQNEESTHVVCNIQQKNSSQDESPFVRSEEVKLVESDGTIDIEPTLDSFETITNVDDSNPSRSSLLIDNSNQSDSLLEEQSPQSINQSIFTFSTLSNDINGNEEKEEDSEDDEEEESENINPMQRKDPFDPVVTTDLTVNSSCQFNSIVPLKENISSHMHDDAMVNHRPDEEHRTLLLTKSELEFFERPSSNSLGPVPTEQETVSFQNLSPTTQAILALYSVDNNESAPNHETEIAHVEDVVDTSSRQQEQKSMEDRIVIESTSKEIEVKSFTDVWLELQPKSILVKKSNNNTLGEESSSSSKSSSSLSKRRRRKNIQWPQRKEDLVSIQYIPRVGKSRSLRLALMQIKKER